ncbi:MAG: Gfo/Idh/MocA family oxidoreductase [Candidatus Omnitrophica bacterium]|nr:Gfo/Idh/MocA family oxidoreductase [Candidatus Omnitrophota bacterium]
MAQFNEFRVVIIGAGYTAREHIRAFADLPGVCIVGIHSRTRSKAEALAKEFGIALVCDSIVDLYVMTRADLVVVTVSELSMRDVSTACFEFPWAVLLEKPAGYDCADARLIKTAAEKKERKVFVALNRRFYGGICAAKASLKEIGSPRFIKVQDQEDMSAALALGIPLKVVKNWMYANSIHMIDLLRVFGRGKIVAVEPVIPWNAGNPGVVMAKIVFDSGDIGIYEGIWDGPGPWSVVVNTPLKRWELRPVEQAGFQNRGERRLQPVELHSWDQAFKPGFRLQAEQVVFAVLGRPSEAVSLAEAFGTMELIEAIFEKS